MAPPLRRLRRLAFLIIRDARGTAQIVIEDPALIATLDELRRESILTVDGTAVANPQAPGGVEVRRPAATVLTAPRVSPPFDLHHPGLNAQQSTVLDHAPVALRHPKGAGVLSRGGGIADRISHCPPNDGLCRDSDPEDRGRSDRGRRQCVLTRLLRPPGLSGAVLQTDHGRRVRARI